MALFCYAVLPVTYNTIGFGVRGFRLEQFFLWAVWVGGSVLAGGDVQEADKYALVGLLMCVTFGAVITKLGVRNAWTWGRIWKRQT